MIPQWIIEKKRDGQHLSGAEIRDFISRYTSGEIPDYQMSALAMAIFFRGMDRDETVALTDAMMRSGVVLDLSDLPKPKVDKHSTGGIGDKTSLILAPLVASCGVAVPMISGRGLGITGGTLDKMESIPGYRADLSVDSFRRVLSSCGCSIMGQTAEIAPADRKLYALRDVTATVPSIPLIAASIMSKKMAEGLDALVLDVKFGRGAFMKTCEDAVALAETMIDIGRGMGKRVAALVTAMDQPLGHTAGNALEVRESIDCLRGHGPEDLMHVTMELSSHMIFLAGLSPSPDAAMDLLRKNLSSGAALQTFHRMVSLHGGDTKTLENPDILPSAPIVQPLKAVSSGFIARADADALGRACIELGAGRRRTEDRVDHAVGLSGIRKIGAQVRQGDTLALIHARSPESLAAAQALANNAFEISLHPVPQEPLVRRILGDR